MPWRNDNQLVPDPTRTGSSGRAEHPEPEVAEPSTRTPTDLNDPALLDEPSLRDAPAEPVADLDPATMADDRSRIGTDPAQLDDVSGDLRSRPDVGGLGEGDDLGIDPTGNDPIGLDEPGLELNPDGTFNPANDLLDNLDSGRPSGSTLDESSAGGFFDDPVGAVRDLAAGLAAGGNIEQNRQFNQVDDGIGQVSGTIEHGKAAAASDADGVDGDGSQESAGEGSAGTGSGSSAGTDTGPSTPDTPSQSGMPELTAEEVTKLADDIAAAKQNLGPDETVDINRHGRTFVVRGAAKTDETTTQDDKPEQVTEDLSTERTRWFNAPTTNRTTST